MRDQAFNFSLLASFLIHGVAIVLASTFVHNTNLRRENFFPISLVDVPPMEASRPLQEIETPPEMKRLPLPPPKTERAKEPAPSARTLIAKPESPAQKQELVKPEASAKTEPAQNFTFSTRVEGGGSETGLGNLSDRGDIEIFPGHGTAGGGGAAVSGLGRASGAPGFPAQQGVLRTNREAKPIQTVRAAYPPMALRMGMESDVTLKIEIDPEGRVTKAEITKSGGAGFDEEALKAVKQSRFEPALKDGHNIPAEFTYVYRFRLQR